MIKRYTYIALTLSIILLGAFFWWFQGNLIATGIYAAISLVSVLSVPLLYRMAGYSDADDVEWLAEREASEHEDARTFFARVRKLIETYEDEGVDKPCECTF